MSWLWDLDYEMIRRTDPNLNMDWELLFRMLSHKPKHAACLMTAGFECETFRSVLPYVPPGLESRQRLWTLVEEMHVGDKSSQWDTGALYAFGRDEMVTTNLAQVSAYWEHNGEPLGDNDLEELSKHRF
ncbi:hypothetical protein HD806DRAFT_544128 [Xylariaceae sp. AK1471]|nr:hypothetical protein HD806DRAFT_544128 [Xylariaceae sp. AK1471]